MARSATDYLRLLQSLLPWGKAWPREEGALLTQLLNGQAQEFARIDNRSEELLEEINTLTTDELLTDHEIELGLPDECTEEYELSTSERRATVNAKLISTGQQFKEYFIEIAERYGFDATIEEFTPCWCGQAVSGDECGDQTNIFYWKFIINITQEVIYFLAGTAVAGDRLQRVSDLAETVFCFANKYKPAHTVLISSAIGPGFSNGFSNGFHAFPSSSEDYLTGGFSQGFTYGFDVNLGGAFEAGAFDAGFEKPA